MQKTFCVQTQALTLYKNIIVVDEEEMAEYQAENPELAEQEIVAEMFMDGNYKEMDCEPIDWCDEQVVRVENT